MLLEYKELLVVYVISIRCLHKVKEMFVGAIVYIRDYGSCKYNVSAIPFLFTSYE